MPGLTRADRIFSTDNTTIYFLKDILARKKAYVPNDKVQTLFVPQYKNLSVERILAFVADKPNISDFLPDDIDLEKVPKQWIVNVCAVVLGNSFKGWVAHQVEERNAEMCGKKEMLISMDPAMAAKFNASTHVSRKYLLCVSALTRYRSYSLERRVSQHAEGQLETQTHFGLNQGGERGSRTGEGGRRGQAGLG